MTASLIDHDINHKAVSLTVTEIWQIENVGNQFDLDLISQGQPKLSHFVATTPAPYLRDLSLIMGWGGHCRIRGCSIS